MVNSLKEIMSYVDKDFKNRFQSLNELQILKIVRIKKESCIKIYLAGDFKDVTEKEECEEYLKEMLDLKRVEIVFKSMQSDLNFHNMEDVFDRIKKNSPLIGNVLKDCKIKIDDNLFIIFLKDQNKNLLLKLKADEKIKDIIKKEFDVNLSVKFKEDKILNTKPKTEIKLKFDEEEKSFVKTKTNENEKEKLESKIEQDVKILKNKKEVKLKKMMN